MELLSQASILVASWQAHTCENLIVGAFGL